MADENDNDPVENGDNPLGLAEDGGLFTTTGARVNPELVARSRATAAREEAIRAARESGKLVSIKEIAQRSDPGADPNDEGAPPAPPIGVDDDAAEKPPEVEPLELINPSMWAGRTAPERRWLIRDWIPTGVVTGLYGDGGLGKTLLAQQLQVSCATGRHFLGMPVEEGVSVGLYCEDDREELQRRQERINDAYGTTHDDSSGSIYLPRHGKENLLMTFGKNGRGELTPFYNQVLECVLDVRAALLIIDTASYTFGGNEIDRSQVSQFVGFCLGGLARAMQGAVVLTAHPSNTGLENETGASGSTGWNNAFRSRMFLTLPKLVEGEQPDPFARVLKRVKANYAPRSDTIEMHWVRGVLRVDNEVADDARPVAEEIYLELLETIKGEGKVLSPKSNATNYGPRLFAARSKSERRGYAKHDFELAQRRLFEQRAIKLFQVKRDRKPVTVVDRSDATPKDT